MSLKSKLSYTTKFIVLCLISIGGSLLAQKQVWSEDMTSSLAEVGWIEQANDGYDHCSRS